MNEPPKNSTTKLKLFLVPALLWGYVCSSAWAVTFWGKFFEKIVQTFDLSPNQGWAFDVFWNLLFAAIGVPKCIHYISALLKRRQLSVLQHLSCLLCIGAVLLCTWVGIMVGLLKHEQVAAAIGESTGNEQEKIFVAGHIADGRYSNDVVGISIQTPKGWQLGSLNLIRRRQYTGAQTAFGTNSRQAEALAAGHPGIYPLLVVHKYPPDHPGYNPSLFINGYDKQAVLASGRASLEAYANGYAHLLHPYYALSGPVKDKFGGVTGYHIPIEARFPAATVQQRVYVLESGLYYVSLTGSFIDEKDWSEIAESISTLNVRDASPPK